MFRQYCRDEPNNAITDSESFKFKSKFLENTNFAGIINGSATFGKLLKCS